MKDPINYFIFTSIIKEFNKDMIETKSEEKINSEIIVKKKDNNIIEYKKNGRILKECLYKDGNSLYFSTINYTGDFYSDEIIGFKFFYENKNLMLIKYPFNFYPDFTFYDSKNEDVLEIIKKHLFEKIDYSKNKISGYKVYMYFYLYSLLNSKKAELEKNKIVLKIIDEDVDSFIPNYINEISKENKNEYIFIYVLLLKNHTGTLFYINGKFYLYDSSHSFVLKLENIFKTIAKKITIINNFIIQNLGTCLFHNIVFLETILSYITKNDKETFISKINLIFESKEFLFNYINRLNDLCGGEKAKIIKNSTKEESEDYFLLNKDIYISKKSFKFRLINYNNLFKLLEIKPDKLVDLILKENLVYLNCFKINLLYDELETLLENKIIDIDSKVVKVYNEKFYKLKYNETFLNDKVLNNYYNYIVSKLNIEESFKLELKNKLKEEIRQELDLNEIIFPEKYTIKDKNDVGVIIKLMKENLQNEIYLNNYYDEFKYYNELHELILGQKESFIKTKKEFVTKFEDFNYKREITQISENKFYEDINKNISQLENTLEELEVLIDVLS